MKDNARFWLWLDARQGTKNPDWPVALSQGVTLFQAKERWGGQAPNVVRAHPEQASNGMEAAARVLGLKVVGDPSVLPGTFRLGLAATEKEGTPKRLKQLAMF
jgi:hypothetical protein